MKYTGVKGLRNLSLQLNKGLGGHRYGRGISAYSLGKAIEWSCEGLATIKLEMPKFWTCERHAISAKKRKKAVGRELNQLKRQKCRAMWTFWHHREYYRI